MDYQQILSDRRGRVGIITLNRPERLNAITLRLMDELYDAFDVFNQDPGISVIVLTGAGRAFCAGLDVQDWENPEPAEGEDQEPMNYRSQLRWLHLMRNSKPVVVAVNGLVVDDLEAGIMALRGALKKGRQIRVTLAGDTSLPILYLGTGDSFDEGAVDSHRLGAN
jgi:1,4-dihydroxy-2-naphthoyl-CoA synthase